ncbi:4428_t:CDS:2 [Gigaspora margarita]|uniref:4428_t:CDS:1 n=1 Tax=Gigaspora margarita TaxID=4874 RepID=A0ABM8VVN4_GIGMA|nr:4428_t:CDS:2 [Gigaspora margarita]
MSLPTSDNIESEPSVKCKRTEELYEHLPEMENTNSTVDCKPEANEINTTKNIKPRKNQKIPTRNQRKGKGRAIQNIETSQDLDQEMRDSNEE